LCELQVEVNEPADRRSLETQVSSNFDEADVKWLNAEKTALAHRLADCAQRLDEVEEERDEFKERIAQLETEASEREDNLRQNDQIAERFREQEALVAKLALESMAAKEQYESRIAEVEHESMIAKSKHELAISKVKQESEELSIKLMTATLEHKSAIAELKHESEDLSHKLARTKEELEDSVSAQAELKVKKEQRDSTIIQLGERIQGLRDEIKRRDAQIADQRNEIIDLQAKITSEHQKAIDLEASRRANRIEKSIETQITDADISEAYAKLSASTRQLNAIPTNYAALLEKLKEKTAQTTKPHARNRISRDCETESPRILNAKRRPLIFTLENFEVAHHFDQPAILAMTPSDSLPLLSLSDPIPVECGKQIFEDLEVQSHDLSDSEESIDEQLFGSFNFEVEEGSDHLGPFLRSATFVAQFWIWLYVMMNR
jgi:chromosome segregation ATPase